MKKTRSGTKYIPEYVYIDGKEVMFRCLTNEQRYAVMGHCKPAHSVETRTKYHDIVTKCTSIMKYGGGFKGSEIQSISERFAKSGHIVQPLVKEANGGGQGAVGWGILHISDTNYVYELLKKHDILEEFSMLPKEKQLNRIQKFIGISDEIEVKPKVLVTDIGTYEGLLKGRQVWMDVNRIPYGAKTTGPTKGLIVPMTDMEEKLYKGYDLVIPECENKVRISADKLERLVMLNRENVPANRYSRNLVTSSGRIGRMPRNVFDLQAHINYVSKVDLDKERTFYETGNYTVEFINSLFGYTDNAGKNKLRKEGELIMAGLHPFDNEVIKETLKSLLTMVVTKLEGRIPGIYGTAMPLEILPKGIPVKHGYITRFPWVFPILSEYAVYEHCIFIKDELMKLFGGDFDGDQVAVYHRMSMKNLPVYNTDKEWLTSIISMPEKVEGTNDKSIEEVMASQVDQYSICGQVYNSCRILEECVRMEGWSYKDVLALGAKLTSEVVQPYIDGFKYMAGNNDVPDIEELAKRYGVPIRWKERANILFSMFRTGRASIPRIVHFAKLLTVKHDSPMYYERIASVFSNWNAHSKIVKFVGKIK